MNEFIEQFLIESRELVEQATDDLLALEKTPDDKARLDSAFRAFHTLKGGAGIVDFAAMARGRSRRRGCAVERAGPEREPSRRCSSAIASLPRSGRPVARCHGADRRASRSCGRAKPA